jgi:beta-phosphoglucomutase-like phosphatase (HAD superfamily)
MMKAVIFDFNQLKPSECVYFDDSDANPKAAKSLGITSVKWESLEKAKKAVEFLEQNGRVKIK